MNTPSPLVPQGTFLGKPGRSHIRIVVFTILAIHVVLLGGLLLQGCKRTPVNAENPQTTNTTYSGWQDPPPPPPSLDFFTNTPANASYGAPPPLPPTVPGADPRPFPGASGSLPPPLPPTTATTDTTPFPGVKEIIPPPPPPNEVPVPTTPTPTGSEYVVLKGDTFSLIAKRAGVSVREIANANPTVDPRRLQIGQKIFVPAPLPSNGTTSGNGTASSANGGKSYTVKSGDTLSAIARNHRTTVKAIRTANNLRTDRIVVGQKLSLPETATP